MWITFVCWLKGHRFGSWEEHYVGQSDDNYPLHELWRRCERCNSWDTEIRSAASPPKNNSEKSEATDE